jgi:hypothetical protein
MIENNNTEVFFTDEMHKEIFVFQPGVNDNLRANSKSQSIKRPNKTPYIKASIAKNYSWR